MKASNKPRGNPKSLKGAKLFVGMLLLSGVFSALAFVPPAVHAVGPTHTAWGENWVEGNWTSWSLYSTHASFGSARAFYVGLSTNGSVLFLEDFSGGAAFYNVATKTLVNPESFNIASNDGTTDHSAYGEYAALVNSSSKSVLMFKGGNLIQNLTNTQYGWAPLGQYPGASMDPTGRWLVVAGQNVTGNFLWFFQGVGTPAPFDEDPYVTVVTSPYPLMDALSVNGTLTSKFGPINLGGGQVLNLTAMPTALSSSLNLYTFDHWSDNGSRSHLVTVPNSNVTYTAYYTAQSTSCSSFTNLFSLLLNRCIVGLWFETFAGVLGNFGAGLAISAIGVALYNKNENHWIALLWMMLASGVLGVMLPAAFAPVAGMLFVISLAGSLVQATRARPPAVSS